MENTKEPTKWQEFSLRMTLLRIWFMKNILVFVEVIAIILLICTLTGAITENTPIFGKIIYPLFSSYIDAVNDAINKKNMDSFINVVTVLLSSFASVGLFTTKLKSIAQNDIKSKKLKYALVRAGYYFNSDGKLVKKVEIMTRTDIDGDGKIGDTNADEADTVTHGVFSGMINAIQELHTILTADFKGKTKEEALQDTKLSEAAEGVDMVDYTVTKGLDKYAENKIKQINEENKKKENEEEDTVEAERKNRVNVFTKAVQNIKAKHAENASIRAIKKAKKYSHEFARPSEESLEELKIAIFDMARIKRGALMIIMGKVNIFTNGAVTQQGTKIDWNIKHQSIEDMFIVGTPLHDGAAIIDGNKIIRAAVFVEPTKNTVKGKFGARHQAAKGISENSDAIAILVSEETGDVLLCFKGSMTHLTEETFISAVNKDLDKIEAKKISIQEIKPVDKVEVVVNNADEDAEIKEKPKEETKVEEQQKVVAENKKTIEIEKKIEPVETKAATSSDPVSVFLSQMKSKR